MQMINALFIRHSTKKSVLFISVIFDFWPHHQILGGQLTPWPGLTEPLGLDSSRPSQKPQPNRTHVQRIRNYYGYAASMSTVQARSATEHNAQLIHEAI